MSKEVIQTQPQSVANTSDFDANALVSQVSDHTRDLNDISEKVSSLEARFGDNEKIARTLTDCAENAVKMRSMLSDMFIDQIKKNDDVKEALTDLINKSDRSAVYSMFKKFGLVGYTILIFIISIIAQNFIENMMGGQSPPSITDMKGR